MNVAMEALEKIELRRRLYFLQERNLLGVFGCSQLSIMQMGQLKCIRQG